MVKKLFALASVTALTGLMAAVAASGCSSTTTDNAPGNTEAGTEAGKVVPPKDGATDKEEAGAEEDAAGPAEEGTVGKLCTATADCNVEGAVNDNECSDGLFTAGDLLTSAVCVQRDCTQTDGGKIGDLLCDNEAGFCIPTKAGSKSGICLPRCEFDSTAVTAKCNGDNKCNIASLFLDDMKKAVAVGYCFGACVVDADCKGTDQKCQPEEGLCVNTDKFVKFAKVTGEGCTKAATGADPECNCNLVGTAGDAGANAEKGFCTSACVTGTAGDTSCNAAAAGWKCTAKLPLKGDMDETLFTAQPPDISGGCALPCPNGDGDCAALVTSSGLTGLIKCKEYAGGKFCEATAE